MIRKILCFFIITTLMFNIILNFFMLQASASDLNDIALDFSPTHVIMDDTTNILYLSNSSNKQIFTYNSNTNETKVYDLEYNPGKLAIKDNLLYVQSTIPTSSKSTINIIDLNGFKLIDTIPIDDNVYDFVIGNNNTLYYSTTSYIYSYSLSEKKVLNRKSSRSGTRLSINSNNSNLYTTYNWNYAGLSMYQTTDGYLEKYSETPDYRGKYPTTNSFEINPTGDYAFCNLGIVYKLSDIETDNLRYFYTFPNQYDDISFDIPNDKIYLACNYQGTGSIKKITTDNFTEISSYSMDRTISYLFNTTDKLIAITYKNTHPYPSPYFITILNKDILQESIPDPQSIPGIMTNPIFNPKTNEAYIIDSVFKTVYVYDCNKNTFSKEYKIPYQASSACISDDGSKLYIANNTLNSFITELDLNTGNVKSNTGGLIPDNENGTIKRIYLNDDKIYLLTNDYYPSLLMFDTKTLSRIEFKVDIGDGNVSNELTTIYDLAITNDKKYLITSPSTLSAVNKYELCGDTLKLVDSLNISYNFFEKPLIITPDNKLTFDENENYILYNNLKINLSNFNDNEIFTNNDVLFMNQANTIAAGSNNMSIPKYNCVASYLMDSQYSPSFFNNEGILYFNNGKKLETLWLIPGDFNGDTEVNIFDLSALSSSYNSKITDTNYKVLYDLNTDGIIDIYDICTLAQLL